MLTGAYHENDVIENTHGPLKHGIKQTIKVLGSNLLKPCHRFLDQITCKGSTLMFT